MVANDLIINGWDADNAGFQVQFLPDRRRFPPRQWLTGRTPLRADHRLLASTPQYGSREMLIPGDISAASSSALEDNLDLLKSRCDSKAEVTLEFANDRANRWFYGRLMDIAEGRRTGLEGPAANNPRQRLVLRFRLADPFSYAKTTTTVTGIGSTGKEIPVGTGPSLRDLELELRGPTTGTVVISLESSTGGVVKRLKLNTVLASTAVGRLINMDNGTITSTGSTNASSERVVGTDFPWSIDHRDGVWSSSDYPVLKCGTSTGGTNGTVKATHRLAYT